MSRTGGGFPVRPRAIHLTASTRNFDPTLDSVCLGFTAGFSECRRGLGEWICLEVELANLSKFLNKALVPIGSTYVGTRGLALNTSDTVTLREVELESEPLMSLLTPLTRRKTMNEMIAMKTNIVTNAAATLLAVVWLRLSIAGTAMAGVT